MEQYYAILQPTPHGDTRSWDDILIVDDQTIIDQYIERFEEAKSRSRQYHYS